jgi:hypothetical protein
MAEAVALIANCLSPRRLLGSKISCSGSNIQRFGHNLKIVVDYVERDLVLIVDDYGLPTAGVTGSFAILAGRCSNYDCR